MDINHLYKQILTEAVDRNKIINAINKKQTLTIYYKADREENEVTGWRRIEPFCCGINKYGNPVLRAWQFSGVSNTYPPGKLDDPLTHVPGWRMFRMDKIVSLAVGWDKFTTERPKYNPDDADMVTIFAAADFGHGRPSPGKMGGSPAPVAPKPVQPTIAPVQAPKPTQQPLPQVQAPKKDIIPQIHPHTAPKSWKDRLSDKFKKLINYRPK